MTGYYLFAERLPETPEIPFSYTTGKFDDDNPAPKGSEEFSTEKQLAKAVETVEKEIDAAIELSQSDEFFERLDTTVSVKTNSADKKAKTEDE